MRIGVIVDWLNPTMEQAIHLLRERHTYIELLYPEQHLLYLNRVRVDHDLYLLKSGTEPALSLAGALHTLGATTLNPYPTVAMMRNKIIVTRALQQAGVPTPETYVIHHRTDLVALLDAGPLILKPYRGSRGEGIRIIRHTSDIGELPPDEPILVQRYHKPDGRDHKIFRIGEQFFGVKRPWPITTYTDKIGEPFTPDRMLTDIARRCGAAFGIDLYGLDIVISDGQPYVVDINKFGSYMGVPNAPKMLADYIYEAAQRAAHNEIHQSQAAAA